MKEGSDVRIGKKGRGGKRHEDDGTAESANQVPASHRRQRPPPEGDTRGGGKGQLEGGCFIWTSGFSSFLSSGRRSRLPGKFQRASRADSGQRRHRVWLSQREDNVRERGRSGFICSPIVRVCGGGGHAFVVQRVRTGGFNTSSSAFPLSSPSRSLQKRNLFFFFRPARSLIFFLRVASQYEKTERETPLVSLSPRGSCCLRIIRSFRKYSIAMRKRRV